MPHIIIEYSADVAGQIDINDLIAATHAAALSSELFTEYDIKTRTVAYEQHRTGQTQDSFVHISVHLLSGRSDELKVMLSEKVLGSVEPLLPQVVSVGVEICDIHRASYRKRVLDAS